LRGQRLIGLDIIKTVALVSMVAYHFTYDLDLFGFLPPYTSVTGFFWWHARLTAGSFIFLAGVSLWLSHGTGIRWAAFWRREVKIIAAAALVTLGFAVVMPGMLVFYGILHSIAVSSLIAVLFLRLPALVTLTVALAAFVLPLVFRDPAFNGWLVWTGLGTLPPVTADFLPFFPWVAPMLAGIALGRGMSHFELWPRLAWPPTRLNRVLAWPARHSLPIYLIHQPLLIGAFNLWFWLAG
jgi:uncharacterized membrane protein